MSITQSLHRLWIGKKTERRTHRSRSRRRLMLECLEDRKLMAGIVMTDYEQLTLELVNRARAAPTAEAVRYGIDLNKDLAAGTISTTAKQPLAPNQFLINSAGLHSQDMLDRDFFAHTNLSGQTPTQRMTAAGYSGQSTGENISWGGQFPAAVDPAAHTQERHASLFRSAGHRTNMMRDAFDELGVGFRVGVFTQSGQNYNASMVTENFGGSWSSQFITGVAFNDRVTADNFYSIGESVSDLTVRAISNTGAIFETVTGRSGGYSLSVPAGSYTVSFITSGGSSYGPSSVVVGSANVKLDLNTAVTVTNAAPLITTNQNQLTVNEGSLATVTGTFSDADGDTVSIGASLGTVTRDLSTRTWRWSYQTTDNAAAQTVTLTAQDGRGGLATTTFSLIVANVAPIATLSGASHVDQYANYTLNIDARTDPGTDTITAMLVNWGDGSSNVVSAGATNATHIYSGRGNFAISVSATDEDGSHVFPSTLQVTVDFALRIVDGIIAVDGTVGDDTVSVEFGPTIRVNLNGAISNIVSLGTPQVRFDGISGNDTITVSGTVARDVVVLRPGRVDLSSPAYSLRADRIANVIVNGAGGTDEVEFFDSSAIDEFTVRPGQATLVAAAYALSANGFATVVAHSSSANDNANFYDTAGDDNMTLSRGLARLQGSGVYYQVDGFRRIYGYASTGNDRAEFQDTLGNDSFGATPTFAHQYDQSVNYYLFARGFDVVESVANAGGTDTADLYDSSGNDTLTAYPNDVTLVGTNYSQRTFGYRRTNIHATSGGIDSAALYDSSGDDRVTLSPRAGSMTANGFETNVDGFRYIRAYANAGGNDQATLNDSSRSDRLGATPNFVHLYDTTVDYYLYAGGFDDVTANATAGGDDLANLYDSVGDEVLQESPTSALFTGNNFRQTINGFRSVYAFASAGNDRAEFTDSNGNDNFGSTSTFAHMYDSSVAYYRYATGFDRYQATSSHGGTDRANLYDSIGDDTLTATPARAELTGSGVTQVADGFAVVTAYASAGNDTANLYDSAGNDSFTARPRDGTMTGVGYINRAVGFRTIRANANNGGSDQADLFDSPADDNFGSTPTFAHLYDATLSYYLFAGSFDRVVATSTAGGADTANLYDSSGNDSFAGNRLDATLSGPGYSSRVINFTGTTAFAYAGGNDTASLSDNLGGANFVGDQSTGTLTSGQRTLRVIGFDQVGLVTTVTGTFRRNSLSFVLLLDGSWVLL